MEQVQKFTALTPTFLKALLAIVLSEMVFWRLLAKLNFPLNSGALSGIFQILRQLGPFALNLAHISAAVVILLASMRLMKLRHEMRTLCVGVGLLVLVQLSFLVRLPGFGGMIAYIYEATFLGLVTFLLISYFLSEETRARFFAFIVAGVYASSAYFRNAPVLSLHEALPFLWQAAEVYSIGEALAVVGSGVLLTVIPSLSTSRSRLAGRALLISFLPALLLLLAYSANQWAITAISIFALGFSLQLPFPLYILSLWAFTYILVLSLSRNRRIGYALGFIFLAGIMMNEVHTRLFGALGLLLLAFPRIISESGSKHNNTNDWSEESEIA